MTFFAVPAHTWTRFQVRHLGGPVPVIDWECTECELIAVGDQARAEHDLTGCAVKRMHDWKFIQRAEFEANPGPRWQCQRCATTVYEPAALSAGVCQP